jgi:hypothetical protein
MTCESVISFIKMGDTGKRRSIGIRGRVEVKFSLRHVDLEVPLKYPSIDVR